SERSILAALQEISEGHSSMVIAHRLSTIVDADKILVLDQGAIAEQGTHAELLKLGGRYADLWASQLRQRQDQGQQ
ncbi:MAG: metal ABC transporter permease, partial [Porticoccaceae bacterium]